MTGEKGVDVRDEGGSKVAASLLVAATALVLGGGPATVQEPGSVVEADPRVQGPS